MKRWRLIVLGAVLPLLCGGAPPHCAGTATRPEVWLSGRPGETGLPLNLQQHLSLPASDTLRCLLDFSKLEGAVLGADNRPIPAATRGPCELFYAPAPGAGNETGTLEVSIFDQACGDDSIAEVSIHFTLFDPTTGLQDPCQPKGRCATVSGMPVLLRLEASTANATRRVRVVRLPEHGQLYRFVEGCVVPVVGQPAPQSRHVSEWDDDQLQRLAGLLIAVSPPPFSPRPVPSPPPVRVGTRSPKTQHPSLASSPVAAKSPAPAASPTTPHGRAMHSMEQPSEKDGDHGKEGTPPTPGREPLPKTPHTGASSTEVCPRITATDAVISDSLPTRLVYLPVGDHTDGAWDHFAIAAHWGDGLDASRESQDVAVFVAPAPLPVAEDIVRTVRPGAGDGAPPSVPLRAAAQHPLGEPLQYFLRQEAGLAERLFSDQGLTQAVPWEPVALPSPVVWLKTPSSGGGADGFVFHYSVRDATLAQSRWATVTVAVRAPALPAPQCVAGDKGPPLQGRVGEDLILNLAPFYTAASGHVVVAWLPPADREAIGTVLPSLSDPAKMKFTPGKAGNHLLQFEARLSETNASCTFGLRIAVQQAALRVRDLCFADFAGVGKLRLKLSLVLVDPKDSDLVKRLAVGKVRAGMLKDHTGKEDLSGAQKAVKTDDDLVVELFPPRSRTKAVEIIQVPITLYTTPDGSEGGFPVTVNVYLLDAADVTVDVYAHRWAQLTLPFPELQPTADPALQVEVQPHKNAPVHVMVAAAGGSEILDPGKATRIDPANTTLVPTDDTAEIAVPFKLVAPDLGNCVRRGKGPASSKAAKVVLRRHNPGLEVVVYKDSPKEAACNQQYSVVAGSLTEFTILASPSQRNPSDAKAVYIPSTGLVFNFTFSGSWTLSGAPLPAYIESQAGTLKVSFQAGEYNGTLETLEISARDEAGAVVECKVVATVAGGTKPPTGTSVSLDPITIAIAAGLLLLLGLAVLLYLRRGGLCGSAAGYHIAASEGEAEGQDMEMGLIPLEAVTETVAAPPPAPKPKPKPKVPALPLHRMPDAAAKPLLKPAEVKQKPPKKMGDSDDDETEGWDAWSNDEDEEEEEWGSTTKKGKSPVAKAKPAPGKTGKAD